MSYYNPVPMRHDDEACEEFHFWRKRFNFAYWLFFFIAFGSMILGKPAKGVIFSFAVSFFWFLAEAVLVARHMKWHMEHDNTINNGRH